MTRQDEWPSKHRGGERERERYSQGWKRAQKRGKRKNREKTKQGGKGIKQVRIKDRDTEKAVRV